MGLEPMRSRLADSDASRYITPARLEVKNLNDILWSERRDSNSCLLVGSQGCLPLHHIRKSAFNEMGLVTGFEPATDCLQDSCSTVEPHQHPVTEVRIALTDLKGMNLPSHCCSISAYP